MMKRRFAVAGLMAAGIALGSACVDQVSPTAPAVERRPARFNRIGDGAERKSGEFHGIEHHFARINEEVAPFGGMFFDRAGRATVYVTDMQAAAAARAAVSTHFYTADGVNRVRGRIRVMEGDHTFFELAEYRNRAAPVLDMAGVVFTDLDEASNRVAVGVEEGADREAISAELAHHGVPVEAVTFKDAEPIHFAATLRDQVRPLAGGLQIVWPEPGGPSFICTLGFNVQRPGQSQDMFVTNSHCSGFQGGVQNTPYTQPSPLIDPTVIAREIMDPNYFTGSVAGFTCPVARVCRFSDASLARYEPGQDVFFGAIHRTTARGSLSGSITIDDANPRLYITDEAPFPIQGQQLDKLGRTTGWTTGQVTQTCVDTNVGGTNITLFCQDFVASGVMGGDSGSPVFNSFGASNHVTLYGILWGGNIPTGTLFVFSALENIEFALTELGPLNTNPFMNPVAVPLAGGAQ